MIRAAIWTVLAMMASAAPASAADEGGLLYPTINFVLLIAVLIYFARKPIQAFFSDRRTAIRKDLDEAAAMKRQAEERYAQWQRKLVDLERELAEIRAGSQERAEAERASLLEDARAAAERIRSDAATAVEHELRRARTRLREEASQLAIELAAGILGEQVTAQDRNRLIDEFIERVATRAASRGERSRRRSAMRSSAAARRYARALFMLADETGAVAKIRAELAQISGLFESEPQLRNALFRPLHPVAERRAVLRSLCERLSLETTLRNFFAYAIDQRRLVDFEAIRAEFERLADTAAGLVKARVTAAAPLDDAQRQRLQSALAARTGQRVELDVSVDPSLIAGAVAAVGNVVFDGSLRTQLSQLRDTLSRGN